MISAPKCRISLLDESFDTEQMKQPVQPYEFRAKPAWQRLLIMIGGVLVNFLLALFIYSMVLFYWGDSYLPTKNMSMGMKFNQQAKEIGFKDGDILLNTDSKTFKGWDADMYRALADAKTVNVLRNGKKVTINMPENMSLLTMLKSDPKFTMPLIPPQINSVLPNSPAEKAGIKAGDRIISVNNTMIDSWFTYNDVTGRLPLQLLFHLLKQQKIQSYDQNLVHQFQDDFL